MDELRQPRARQENARLFDNFCRGTGATLGAKVLVGLSSPAVAGEHEANDLVIRVVRNGDDLASERVTGTMREALDRLRKQLGSNLLGG